MLRRIAALCLALAFAPAALAAPDRTSHTDRAAWAAACRHYDNRARFLSRDSDVAFVTVLAEGCAAALPMAESPQPSGALARLFLTRLAGARAMIGEINADRIRVAHAGAEGFSRGARDLGQAMRLVSDTGEFLILREEGVFRALGAWADSGVRFDLIAALPR